MNQILINARVQRGWTQQQLAEAANCSQARIAQIESGGAASVALAERVAGLLSISEMALLYPERYGQLSDADGSGE